MLCCQNTQRYRQLSRKRTGSACTCQPQQRRTRCRSCSHPSRHRQQQQSTRPALQGRRTSSSRERRFRWAVLRPWCKGRRHHHWQFLYPAQLLQCRTRHLLAMQITVAAPADSRCQQLSSAAAGSLYGRSAQARGAGGWCNSTAAAGCRQLCWQQKPPMHLAKMMRR